VIGDGEAETGPLAASWHSNKFLNPRSDGAVLPILHLNGYKIASPSVLARIGIEELDSLMTGYGHRMILVEGSEPEGMHQQMAAALDEAFGEIRSIQEDARAGGHLHRPRWPMIVLKSPKGWTGPAEVDGRKMAGSWRSHQVPFSDPASNPKHLAILERWLQSYQPRRLFDANGAPRQELLRFVPCAIGAWARTRTRTAACCCGTSCYRTFATMRCRCRNPHTPMRSLPG